MYARLLRRVLFRLDAEKAHNLALWAVARGLVRGRLLRDERLACEVFGARFPNPLGLAAGFDKNGVALGHWHRLGFGFVEVGTVTRHGQPGNPKPRMFRLPEDRALINRLGFNNRGADALAGRLAGARCAIPYGVNLGKSKVTALEDAAEDYAYSYGALRGYGAYFVVNVSSPNTPGLRSLQSAAELGGILGALRGDDGFERPVLVKVSPDLAREDLDAVVRVVHDMGAAGIVATNTTLARDGLVRDPGLEGGLSGAPLRARADEVLGYLASACDARMVLVGVGGVFTGADLYRKLALGADLCQVYTGFVYGGPGMAAGCLADLLVLLDREGVTLSELRLRGRCQSDSTKS